MIRNMRANRINILNFDFRLAHVQGPVFCY